MTKIELARMLENVSWRAKKEQFDVTIVDTKIFIGGSDELMTFGANSAGVQLVSGKLPVRGVYIFSRGNKIHGAEPVAVIEYSHHWPYDFCYVYKL